MSVSSAAVGAGDADVQAAFASTLVDEWVRGGVRHAVVCPGSRSTPVVVALAAHPALEVHVRLDERSAGFTALGIGRVGGGPALVVTTSGTAAAELHAAVVEADLGGVPLIACTADRPPELRDVGAPQTIDQHRLFGGAVRWFCDPGVADRMTRASWRSTASRSVVESTSGRGGPGPVHLNLPFREPLLGDPERAGGVSPGRSDGMPWHQVASGPVPPPVGVVRSLVESGRLDPERRGLIVAGAGAGRPDAVLTLAESLGWPILAEPRSGVRLLHSGVISAADGILRSDRFAGRHLPEVILELGERWVSKVVNRFLSSAVGAGAEVIAVESAGPWRDPEREVAVFVRADPSQFCAEVLSHLALAPSDASAASGGAREWGRAWCQAESRARSVVSATLGPDGGVAGSSRPLTEPALAHRVFARMPEGSTLVVSSSMPVRDVESYASPATRPFRVVANRGANGIDGVISTALGVAIGSSGPTVALVGDLAFLHDASALVRAGELNPPLTVVVADNNGGGIFSFLDPAAALEPEVFESLFGTPQTSDVAAVAAGFGWPVDDCGPTFDPAGFEAVLDRRVRDRAMSVIRVRLPERDENVALHRRLNAAIVEAVER